MIKDIAVSRHHLNFYLEESSLIVEDAGSQNGFTVNGKISKEAIKLEHNDSLGVGKRVFRVIDAGRENDFPVESFIEQASPAETFRMSEEVQKSSSRSQKKSLMRPLLIAAIVAIVLLGVLSKQESSEQDDSNRTIASQAEVEGVAEQPLPSSGYKSDNFRYKSVNEIRSKAKFKEAMRDYNNLNYTRALLLFQEARTLNPANELALTYENYTVQKIEQKLSNLEKDAERSVSRLQFRRAKIQCLQILTTLSEEVPGLAQKITKEALNRSIAVNKSGKVRFRSITQEETLLHIPCQKTKRKKLCEKALRVITLSRQRLGEEDVIQ